MNSLTILIFILGIVALPYGISAVAKLSAIFTNIYCTISIEYTKLKCKIKILKCKIKILKSKIKYFIVEYYAYIKTKYWTKKFIKKQIRVAKRIKNYQCVNDLKSVIKRINKMNKDEFRIYSDRLASGLSGMISA